MVEAVLPLVVEPFDRFALETAIKTALLSKRSRIFLDTSTLIWLYGLHEAARKEIVDWAINGLQAGRVHIPRRALHEFSRHRRDASVLLPFRQQLKGLSRSLKQLDQWAHLIVDDARAVRCGFESRAKYFAAIKKASKDVELILNPVTIENSIESLDVALVPIFNQLALDTDIYKNLNNLQKEYEARAEVRMPPGFKDAKKAKIETEGELNPEDLSATPLDRYGSNRFGDFAIWEEIIGFCATNDDTDSVIILTHDQKPDWSYTPQKIIDLDGRTKPNEKGQLRVTVAHPLLAHEARLRANITTLHIITMPQLAWVANNHPTGLSLIELSRAVQVEAEAALSKTEEATPPDTDEASVESAEDKQTSQETSPPGVGQQPPPAKPESQNYLLDFLRSPNEQALADRLFTRDPLGSKIMNQTISKLKSSNWYTQNPAATEGLQEMRAGGVTVLQAFIFGRNIYQAACGSAGTPIAILENLVDELSDIRDELAVALYAGALFEAYFNKDGEIRSRPKAQQITPLFAVQDEPRFYLAIEWIRTRLANVEQCYLVLPSAHPVIKHLEIDFDDEQRIVGIHMGTIVLSETWDDHAEAEPIPPRSSYEKLRNQVSRHFALPLIQFTLKPSYEGSRETSVLQLKNWGPKTGLSFSHG